MKLLFPTFLLSLALVAPAWADEATLEGYGGDGALLVGVGGGDSPFGDRAPATQGGGGSGGGNDGNLVAENGPAPSGGTQGAATSPTQSAPAPEPAPTPDEPASGGNGQRSEGDRPADGGSEPQPNRPEPAPQAPAAEPAEPAPVAEGAESSGGGAGSLPFTSTEFILLLVALGAVGAMGFGMQRLAASQPRF